MVNKIILIGNVGKDPEVRTVGETKVATFSLATSESYKEKSGEKKTKTQWHNIQLWRGLAELTEKYVKKGNQLYIEGKVSYREYTDKEGAKKYITEIIGDNMRFLGGKKEESSQDQTPAKDYQQTINESIPEDLQKGFDLEPDDLPF